MSHRYFAYGSNLDPKQLRRRCPQARWLGRAELLDHQLAFTRYSPARRCGVADVPPSPGDRVWGCCFVIGDEGLATLDRIEGFTPGSDAYQRIEVEVKLNEETVTAWTYQVANPRPFIPPSASYRQHLIDGARHWRLPEPWIKRLMQIPVAEQA